MISAFWHVSMLLANFPGTERSFLLHSTRSFTYKWQNKTKREAPPEVVHAIDLEFGIWEGR